MDAPAAGSLKSRSNVTICLRTRRSYLILSSLLLSYLISLSRVCVSLWICKSLSRIALLNAVIKAQPPPPLFPLPLPRHCSLTLALESVIYRCCNHGNSSPTISLQRDLLLCSLAIYHSSGRFMQLSETRNQPVQRYWLMTKIDDGTLCHVRLSLLCVVRCVDDTFKRARRISSVGFFLKQFVALALILLSLCFAVDVWH